MYVEVQHTDGLYLLVGTSVVPDEQFLAPHLDATKNSQPAEHDMLACQTALDTVSCNTYASYSEASTVSTK